VEALKTAEPSAGAAPGETLQYTVTLTNVGTAAATDVVFTDMPGEGLLLVPGSVDTTAGTIISGNDSGDTSVEVEVDTIAPGATVTITFAAQVADPLPAGVTFLRNQGLATSTDNPDGEPTDNPATPSDDDPTDTSLQGTVDLAAVKTDVLVRDLDGDGQASPGDTLRYLMTLSNTGTAAATGVRFTDTPDNNSTLVVGSVRPEGSVTTGNTDGDTTVVVDLGTLAGGAEATVRFDVLINATLPAGVEQLENQGILTAVEVPEEVPTDDPDTGTAADPTVTPLAAARPRPICR
jgi:uncharacterized repeat protein (TIGR01451 family)